MNVTFERRSSALGITSMSMAFIVIIIFSFAIRSVVSIQAGSVVITTRTGELSNSAYLSAALCLLGFALGVEGYRRTSSQKVLAVVGLLMNATLLLLMFILSPFGRLFLGPLFDRILGPME